MEIYEILDTKFKSILSGICLTTFREENSRIVNKHEFFQENEFLKIRNDFITYIKNFLFLKEYNINEIKDNVIFAEKNNKNYNFLVTFDWQENNHNIKLKILDNGVKTDFSSYDGEYMFIISIQKKSFYLLNSKTLKNQIKINRDDFKILKEEKNLFKSQFVDFDISKIDQKIKIFSLK